MTAAVNPGLNSPVTGQITDRVHPGADNYLVKRSYLSEPPQYAIGNMCAYYSPGDYYKHLAIADDEGNHYH